MPKGNTRALFLNAPNAAEAARVIGKDGKAFRTYLRKLGKYASKGNGWANMTAKERGDVFVHFNPAPKVTRTRKVAAQPDAPVAEATVAE